ncbi:MAG: cobalt-precorrin-5B (C(1))-methyltransferase CbiD [Filifactoraceae bacterium]
MKKIYKNGEFLKSGYTTGSCVSAGALAGAKLLLTGEVSAEVKFMLANGDSGVMELKACYMKDGMAISEVIKDGGDDPDITTGMIIGTRLRLIESGIEIVGNEGIGVVGVQGLRVSKGQWAINPKPKEALIKNLELVKKELGYTGGFWVEVFAPEGELRAKNTYNARLGIKGGISILGTTGIVEPMSEVALVETIKLDMDRWFLNNKESIIIAPGNYGKDYCQRVLGFKIDEAVKISNYLGEALDYIRFKGFKKVLFVGHMGKLVKVAGGIMNTHSSYGDGRMEIMAAYGALEGASKELIGEILLSTTTDRACELLEAEGILDRVMKRIVDRIIYHLKYRLGMDINVDTVLFGKDESMTFSSLD